MTFLHSPLNEKVVDRKSNPVIVIDPKVNKDLLFFEKRIEAAYGSYVDKVEMPYVNHGTAEAMLSQGVLKSFVLGIFCEGVVKDFCFNPEDNCFSLSEMALDAAKTKKFDYANYCLARLAELGGRPRGLTRLKAYQILIEHGSLRHFFSRDDIYASEKRAVHRAHFKRVKDAEDQQSVLLSQFKMNMELLDYEDAKSMALKIKSVYRVFEAHNQMIKKVEKHLANSNSWIV